MNRFACVALLMALGVLGVEGLRHRANSRHEFFGAALGGLTSALGGLAGAATGAPPQAAGPDAATLEARRLQQEQALSQQAAAAALKEQKEREAAEREAAIQEWQERVATLPPGPRVHIPDAEETHAEASALAKQLDREKKRAQMLEEKVAELLSLGIQHGPEAAMANEGGPSEVLQSLEGEEASVLPPSAMEAPIVWLNPPPLSPHELAQVNGSVQCLLASIGDANSPAMKKLRAKELEDLSKISGTSLEDVEAQLAAAETLLTERTEKRQALAGDMKAAAETALSTKENTSLAAEKYLAADVAALDTERGILVQKISKLKQMRADLAKKQAILAPSGDDTS